MQAIILAAGQGKRLAEFNPDGRPKCLFEFDGKSLLSRQLGDLYRLGIHQVTLVVGYEADMIIEHVAKLDTRPEVAYVYNPAYAKGSVLSLLAAQEVLRSNAAVVLLDADVLYHPDLIKILVESIHQNVFLTDQDKDSGRPSVGFFKLDKLLAAEVADTCASYNADGLRDASHDEILSDVIFKHADQFTSEDVSSLPYLTIASSQDIERAIKDIQSKV